MQFKRSCILNASFDSASLPYVECKSDLRRTSFISLDTFFFLKYLNAYYTQSFGHSLVVHIFRTVTNL